MFKEQEKDILQSIVIAISIHIIFFVLMIIFQSHFFSMRKSYDFSLDQYAMQVDVVGMPELTLKELSKKKVERTGPLEIQTKKVSEKIEEKKEVVVKNEPSSEDLLLQGLAKWKKKNINTANTTKANEVAAPASLLSKQEEKKLNQLIYKGNKLQQGGSRPNLSNMTDNPVLVMYIDKVVAKIRSFWRIPSAFAHKNFKCRIRIILDTAGRIAEIEIIQSSGDKSYDSMAQGSIQAAAPFSPAPKEIHSQINKGSFILGFPL